MSAKKGYPRFLRRLQAVLIDNIILTVLFMSTLLVAAYFGITGRYAIIITGFLIFLWEPLLVSMTGGTIGHHLIGLRVVNSETGNNINLFASIIRFVTKMLLGGLSVVFVFITQYHQAIHDGLVQSVVILKQPETKPNYEVMHERLVELAAYKYPSVLYRSIMIVLYNSVLIYLMGTIIGLLLPTQCLVHGRCTIWQELMLTIWQLLWLVGVVAIIVLCWKGRLLACRRKIIKEGTL